MMEYFILLSIFFVSNAYCENTVSVGEVVSRIDSIEQQCAAQNIQLKEENQKLSKQIEELKTTLITQLHYEIKELRQFAVEKIQHIDEKRNKKFVMDENETVAFHATLGGGAIEHLHINQTIIFNNVMLTCTTRTFRGKC